MLAGICSATGADFRPFTSTPRGWLEKMYDSCGTVWVTADSISMIYEALSAGCRVGVIPVRWKKKENKFQRSLDFLVSEKRIVFFPDSPEESVIAEHLDEAGRCAGEIIRRWQKKN
jgi:mitochondrial fission protein ELM1